MSSRKNKSLAIVFIILFLGYYQRWLYAVVYETVGGAVDLDPALPMILDGVDKLRNQPELIDERSDLIEREANSAAVVGLSPIVYLETDRKKQKQADILSTRIQTELSASQGSFYKKNGCKGPKLSCGSAVDCGLGCQIHNLMSCLMVAYVTNRTLIPDFKNWPYATPWTRIFKPVGASNCGVDNETATVKWGKPSYSLSLPDSTMYTHKSGLPVPLSIGPDLKKLQTDHYIWWIGQFAKYSLRLQPEEEELMRKFKEVLKLNLPTVGIIVRKRDKRGERRKLENHSIDKYMSLAKRYFMKLEETQENITRRVFISTDDKNVFKLIRKRYRPPRWEILGFQRKTELEDIIKDIYMLSECRVTICSFSADICRLVLELKESKDLNSIHKVKSPGYKYFYSTPGFSRLRFLLRY